MLALVVLLSLLATMLPCSIAAVTEEEDLSTYVLHHNVSDDDYDGPNLQYFSPYVTDYIFEGTPSFIQSNIFSLYNTVNKEVIPTYCTDIKVGALPDHRYRRLNLEDSTYAAGAAGKLRAIVRNGFYIIPKVGESMEEHAARVAVKLEQLGAACGVPDLTIGEAISGTQTAIWQAAHGDDLKYTDFLRTIYTTKMPSATKYYDLCNEERENGHIGYSVSAYGKVTVSEETDARITSRIRAVYDYLLTLAPMEASAKAVSPASFENLADPVWTLNEDGTYDVSVTTTVNVDMAAGDDLTLRASLDGTYYDAAALSDGRQTVTLSLEDVPGYASTEDVTLTIQGNQTVSVVFLYDAYGDRETAQSMIGMDGSRLPVYASVRATNSRILNFYKTALVATGNDTYERRPLEGIIFDIYFVTSMNDYLTGAETLPEAKDYALPEFADFTVITDSDGRGSLNLTQQGMEDGVYLVVERPHSAIVKPVDPFYVIMPTTNADGTGYDYEITVQPKNDVKGSMRIEKDVTSIGNDASSVGIYDTHTWIIGTNIPEDIVNGKSYAISDTLDNRLDYIGNLKVQLETEDGQTVVSELIGDTDYVLSVTDVDSLAEDAPSDAFRLELTRNGMVKIANAVGNNSFEDYMLRVYFDAQINANAEVATEIPNQASLEYVNSVNFDFHVVSDKPVVYSGAANLLKVDSGDHTRVLPGAVFEVYRTATAEEVAAGGEGLTHINGVGAAVVKVSFFDNAELTGEKVTSVITDETGAAAIYGLAYGEYYLVETVAPEGYNLLDQAVVLTINGTSHTEDQTVSIENVSGSLLPSTGGIGTWMFTGGGMALIVLSVLLSVSKKRKPIV
jgi:fimbrial isopeptide formation D2 family protein/LPXTG-motif cell wall-anchored protein